MATAAVRDVKDFVFEWEGKDKNGKVIRGEVRSSGEAQVSAQLRRQGVLVTKVKKRRTRGGSSITQKDIAVFTRQLATMMKAGVPLMQSFDIVARGSPNPRLTKLLTDIRSDVETGTSLSVAFRKHPMQFNALYCNLVEAGEQGGILEQLLERLALYEEKTMQLKQKIKSALIYPAAVIVVAFIVLTAMLSPYDLLTTADFTLALSGYCVAIFAALTASALSIKRAQCFLPILPSGLSRQSRSPAPALPKAASAASAWPRRRSSRSSCRRYRLPRLCFLFC